MTTTVLRVPQYLHCWRLLASYIHILSLYHITICRWFFNVWLELEIWYEKDNPHLWKIVVNYIQLYLYKTPRISYEHILIRISNWLNPSFHCLIPIHVSCSNKKHSLSPTYTIQNPMNPHPLPLGTHPLSATWCSTASPPWLRRWSLMRGRPGGVRVLGYRNQKNHPKNAEHVYLLLFQDRNSPESVSENRDYYVSNHLSMGLLMGM